MAHPPIPKRLIDESEIEHCRRMQLFWLSCGADYWGNRMGIADWMIEEILIMGEKVKLSFYRRLEEGIPQDHGMSVFERDGKLFRLDTGEMFTPNNICFVLEDTIEVTQESFDNIRRSMIESAEQALKRRTQ